MTFEGFDVEAEPERRRDLEPFGVSRVPATIVGGRVVHGWNPKALAELVGARYAECLQLAPAELARRLDAVLAATQRAIATPSRRSGGGNSAIQASGSCPVSIASRYARLSRKR